MSPSTYPKAMYELRPSRLVPGQVGLFALTDFKAGDVVIEDSNWDESRLVSWAEFDELAPETRKKLVDFCYKTHEGIHAPQNINRINIGYYINHSCDPCICVSGNYNYVAARDIRAGEELTLDVEALMKITTVEFECHCGSIKCRRNVRI